MVVLSRSLLQYYKKNSRMGESMSRESEGGYSANLTLIDSTEDGNFGQIGIYRTRDPPYEYVMDFKKNFVEENDRMGRYLRLMKQLKNMEHKNLAKMHECQVVEEQQMCIKHKKVHTFCNYYNFTLAGAVEKKKLQEGHFPQTQLIYIMASLLEAATYLQKYGISLGEYRTHSIYLSPQGYIKLYLLEVEEDNRHSCYYKVCSERSQLDHYILSPEQLHFINQFDYDIKYDVYKADVFAIAMVMLELITLDKAKFYYNQAKTDLKMDRIAFDLSSMAKNHTQPFIALLHHCLHPDPTHRLTLQQALDQLTAIRKSMKTLTYCIRLQEEEDKAKKSSHKREATMCVKGQHILNGLQKKLTPSPISTLSSSTSSNLRVESKTASNRASQVGPLKL